MVGIAGQGDRHAAVAGELGRHRLAVQQHADLIGRDAGGNRQLQLLAIGGEGEDGAVLPGGTAQPALHPGPLDHGRGAAAFPSDGQFGLRRAFGGRQLQAAGRGRRRRGRFHRRPGPGADFHAESRRRADGQLVAGQLAFHGHQQRHAQHRVVGGRRLLQGQPVAGRQATNADASPAAGQSSSAPAPPGRRRFPASATAVTGWSCWNNSSRLDPARLRGTSSRK